MMVRSVVGAVVALILATTFAASADVPRPKRPPPDPKWGHFEGVIRHKATGKPAGHIFVQAQGEGIFTDASTHTDANGFYRLPPLPAGKYKILAADGWASSSIRRSWS